MAKTAAATSTKAKRSTKTFMQLANGEVAKLEQSLFKIVSRFTKSKDAEAEALITALTPIHASVAAAKDALTKFSADYKPNKKTLLVVGMPVALRESKRAEYEGLFGPDDLKGMKVKSLKGNRILVETERGVMLALNKTQLQVA